MPRNPIGPQNALTAQGQDAQAVLKKLGITIMDWSNLGAWFSAYFSENALRNDGATPVRMLNIHAPGGFDRRIGLPG